MTRGPAGVAALLLLAGCVDIQSPLAPTGDQANALHRLLVLMTIVCGAVYAVVLGGLVWSLCRARQRLKRDRDDRLLDRGLWTAAAVIVVGLTVLIIGSFVAERALVATRDDPVLHVRVTGHQWWWRIEYRDPASGGWVETANEMHLPVGRTTRVSLGSADVIHSFWLPNVAGKIDMIPGRRNQIDLTPRRAGWFRGQCAEFCGTQHAHMALDVKVDAPADFDRWLIAQARPAGTGAPVTFVRSCAACHTVRGTSAVGRAGPDLTHVAARRSIAAGTLPMTRGALQGWIQQPQALKPGTSMPAVPMSAADGLAVADYVAGLR